MSNTNEIALQNDNFRKHLSQGTLVLTQGIRSNTKEDLEAIITKVRNFDTFDENTIKGKSKPELNLVEYLRERREFKQGKTSRGLYDFLTSMIK